MEKNCAEAFPQCVELVEIFLHSRINILRGMTGNQKFNIILRNRFH